MFCRLELVTPLTYTTDMGAVDPKIAILGWRPFWTAPYLLAKVKNEFCKNAKNTFFIQHLLATASEDYFRRWCYDT